jgi:hypothetical protein
MSADRVNNRGHHCTENTVGNKFSTARHGTGGNGYRYGTECDFIKKKYTIRNGADVIACGKKINASGKTAFTEH